MHEREGIHIPCCKERIVTKTMASEIHRRKFLKILGGILTGVPLLMVFPLIKKRRKFMVQKRDFAVSLDVQEGISFFKDCIVHRRGDDLKVYSSRCSHLGCRINRQMGNELVCPCHGSHYSLEGKVLSGPAAEDLPSLDFKINEKEKKIIISIPV